MTNSKVAAMDKLLADTEANSNKVRMAAKTVLTVDNRAAATVVNQKAATDSQEVTEANRPRAVMVSLADMVKAVTEDMDNRPTGDLTVNLPVDMEKSHRTTVDTDSSLVDMAVIKEAVMVNSNRSVYKLES